LVAPWAEAWSVAGLERRLDITFSPRFRTSLGRCAPHAGKIRLAAFLLTGPPEVLREALCHEAAHAAVYELHGAGVKPHGTEWRALMEAVGFEPRARLPANLVPEVLPRRGQPKRLWEHRCPVCHASRMARRRVPRWRCAACRAAGLEGELTITELRRSSARSL
jgi:predicted SprT family Zn-dependent metalloprotease